MSTGSSDDVLVFFGIGSNLQREKHVQAAVRELAALFHETPMTCSSVYESEALGFEGPPFYNLVTRVKTSMCLADVQAKIRMIESRYGRPPDAEKFSSRTLDIDILTYGDCVQSHRGDLEPALPRAEILTSPFVLKPLSELAPHGKHPVCGDTYAELWRRFAARHSGVNIQKVTHVSLVPLHDQ
ncbi:2-amino-4-hydroxy-6-hydroxymethyldihydropteridine diphosphokinase [Aliidiomarina sanyensis]|uniref:2-amino-4-hydroxy-6-hydroxymethyldihydropteridine diphosphokinase n=1 Tax=Aliidiomarina sanyensis TaxID=1249555 RepID=A0A432WCP1_9GAMM|nr:2-amino-4-hydroxy-6-hydroxymethyldihydropteridine diphosphokinase [Aliidiomarina sanyensis]RUO29462.1 2-amino-4-hydroxy-6-hydroxymethyldihydropteridine diphosphokinase [Aliidiomarina sanyensis]